MSLATVKPAMAAAASSADARRTVRPITNASSTSQSTASDTAGIWIGSRAPMSASANFANSVG
jgi:hypothetical protein